MFNKEDLQFLKEAAEKNLVEIKANTEYLTERLAAYGTSLGECNVAAFKLQRILETIVESEKEKNKVYNPYMSNNSRCC